MEKLTAITGAIFDLDGTLLDSSGVWDEIDRRFLADRGIAVPGDYAQTVSEMEFSRAAGYTIARFGLPDTPEALMREWTRMAVSAYAHEVTLKPQAREFLCALAQRGVGLAAATSSAPEMFAPALRRNGIYELFSCIVTTEEVGAGKENPAVYLRAAQKLGRKPCECAVFEDIPTGIRTARRAGFVTVGVYDEGAKVHLDALRQEADCFVNDFAQALNLL